MFGFRKEPRGERRIFALISEVLNRAHREREVNSLDWEKIKSVLGNKDFQKMLMSAIMQLITSNSASSLDFSMEGIAEFLWENREELIKIAIMLAPLFL